MSCMFEIICYLSSYLNNFLSKYYVVLISIKCAALQKKKYLNKFNLPSSNSLVARHDNEFMKYK